MRVAARIAVFGALLTSCGDALGETSAADAVRAAIAPSQPFGGFDDAEHNEIRARRVEATLPNRRHQGWCRTTDGSDEQKEHEEYVFFRSPQWKPLQVTSRCTQVAPSAVVEARAIDEESAWAAPRPALERCMHTHANRWVSSRAVRLRR